MKQTTLTQRLLSALVALCMVLSVCAPAFADVTDPDMAKAAQWCTEHRSVEQDVPRSLMPAVWMPCSVRTFSVKMGLLQNSSLKKS